MKYSKSFFNALTSIFAGIALAVTPPTIAGTNEPIKLVTTFSVLGDMAKRIGGKHVVVTNLVGPDGDTHVYQPTPSAARAVKEAELLIINALGFEGWLDRLIHASDFDGRRVVATKGIDAIAYAESGSHDDHDDHDDHDHGKFDPHAWQSLENAVIYVNNITDALVAHAPDHAVEFYQNRAAYLADIYALDAEIRAMVAELPESQRTVVTSHDAFQYFGRSYGLTFLAPQGLSTESKASARDVARLIEQMRTLGISAAFVENLADPRLIEQIARETGATVGGTLYPGALSGPTGSAATYLDMMRHNATTILKALDF